jgi:hypothetical protein
LDNGFAGALSGHNEAKRGNVDTENSQQNYGTIGGIMTVLTSRAKTKDCKICRGKFLTRNSTQKYCSYPCAKEARRKQTAIKTSIAARRHHVNFKKEYDGKISKLTLKCKTCKQPYDRYRSQVKWRGSTYCSMECKAAGQIKFKTKGQLVKDLDALYSRYIRHKYADGNMVICVSCGKPDEINNMQNGHYVSRGFYATRWHDKNCHPQCYRCNIALKGNYAYYTKFMLRTYGEGIIDELIELSSVAPNFSKADILNKLEALTVELKRLL